MGSPAMIKKLITAATCTLFLILGCSYHLGFKTTNTQNDGITESTQGISSDLDLDLSKITD